MSLSVDIEKNLGGFRLDVKFEAEAGEALALLGAAGCGKSLTLRCIAGIEKPDRGRIVLNGRVLFDSERHINLKPQKRRVGYLFQQYALFPNMTVYQNIAAGARHLPDTDARVREKIDALRLTGLEHMRPANLSGGQQQRVALARILINEPEALLLDEPFSALDSYLRWELEIELTDTLSAFGGPSLFVSHSREEVFRLCHRVCVLSEGRSEGIRDVTKLFAHPETRASCLLSGCKNLSRITRLGGGRVRAEDWGVELETGAQGDKGLDGIAYIGVKSRHLNPAAPDGKDKNAFPCTIARIVEDERRYIVVLASPAGREGYSLLNMTAGAELGARLREGDALTVAIAPEDIMLLRE